MICISTTSDSTDILKKIASELLNKKLSPCTHITEIIHCGYIWEDEIVQKNEFKLEIKTIESHQKEIISIIKENHNYKVFELSLNKIDSLNSEYNDWFKNQFKL